MDADNVSRSRGRGRGLRSPLTETATLALPSEDWAEVDGVSAVRLTVRLVAGMELQVSALSSDTVLELKRKLLPHLPQARGIAVSRLKLTKMTDVQPLANSAATLASYSIEDGAELLLVLMRGALFSDDQLERLKTGIASLRPAGLHRLETTVLHEILTELCESEAGACSEELRLAQASVRAHVLARPQNLQPSLLFYLPKSDAVEISTELLGAFGDRDDLRQDYVLVEGWFSQTAVHRAARGRDPGVLQVLLNALDPDRYHHHRLSAMRSATRNYRPTPLHFAVLYGEIESPILRAIVDVLMRYARKCGDVRELLGQIDQLQVIDLSWAQRDLIASLFAEP
jgi:hypothetical protein